MSSVKASIIICTKDRADSLRETLRSIGRCEVPADLPTELVVVDNGSTDHTHGVLEEVQATNIPVRYVSEPNRGKGFAYNRGLAEAAGEVFLFTDDDVRVPRNWIEGMCRAIAEDRCDAVAGGVRFAEHLQREWLTPLQRAWMASTSGMEADAGWRMVGANMAFSRRVLGRVPTFDTELGPGALGFGDETLFSHQLVAAGYRLSRALEIEVEHHFDSDRLSRKSLEEIATKMGRSQAYCEHHRDYFDRTYPRLRWLKHVAELRMKRLLATRGGVVQSEGISDWEMLLLHDIGLFSQLCIEQRRPRNYEKYGLQRLENGGQPRC